MTDVQAPPAPAPAPKPIVLLEPKTTWWDRIVRFFKDSEVIFFARLQMFVAAALSVLAAMNFEPLISAGVPSKQQWFLYGILFAQGLVTEIARRRRATDLE